VRISFSNGCCPLITGPDACNIAELFEQEAEIVYTNGDLGMTRPERLLVDNSDGPAAPADGVGEHLRRLRLSNVAVARTMDENPRPKPHCRSPSAISDEQQIISGRSRHCPPRQCLQAPS
jgi:hypothetical protein